MSRNIFEFINPNFRLFDFNDADLANVSSVMSIIYVTLFDMLYFNTLRAFLSMFGCVGSVGPNSHISQ